MQSETSPLELADALIAQGEAEKAANQFRAQIAAGRGGLLARLALARALSAVSSQDEALEVAREAVSLYPNLPEAVSTLARAHLQKAQLPAAIAEFQRALRIAPDFVDARLGLGEAWLAAGEPEKALEAFGELDTKEALPEFGPLVARADAMRKRSRADEGYVRHLFDQFSADYDSHMRGQLGYQAPEILRSLAKLVLVPSRPMDILDLGCGTGLAGVAFRDLAGRLNGIDLSPAMLEKARALGIYDDLITTDIERALANAPRHYDLLLAADTLVYLGDLDAVFSGAAGVLKNGGLFLFTVERSDAFLFELGPKRRWRHSETYLRTLATQHGFSVAGLLACHPRSEASVPVEGLAVALLRP